MNVAEYGSAEKPVIMLIHGENLSGWMWRRHVSLLEDDYRVLVPVLDGHGGEGTFTTVEHCADQLIAYLDAHCAGKALCLCGFALGGQIALTMLAKRPDIAPYGLIESAVVIPKKLTGGGARTGVGMQNLLMKWKGFARFQSQAMYITDSMFSQYYEDAKKMSKTSQTNLLLEIGGFSLPPFTDLAAKLLIVYGDQEERPVKASGQKLSGLHGAKLIVVKNCGHGFCLRSPQQYVMMVRKWTEEKNEN